MEGSEYGSFNDESENDGSNVSIVIDVGTGGSGADGSVASNATDGSVADDGRNVTGTVWMEAPPTM